MTGMKLKSKLHLPSVIAARGQQDAALSRGDFCEFTVLSLTAECEAERAPKSLRVSVPSWLEEPVPQVRKIFLMRDRKVEREHDRQISAAPLWWRKS